MDSTHEVGRWMVIAYRKICDADVTALKNDHLLPRRFELHQGLSEIHARRLFDIYKQSSQVLAVELYSVEGLVARHDCLMRLSEIHFSETEVISAIWAPKGADHKLPY